MVDDTKNTEEGANTDVEAREVQEVSEVEEADAAMDEGVTTPDDETASEEGEAADSDEDDGESKPKTRMMMFAAIGLMLVLGVGGGAGYYFLLGGTNKTVAATGGNELTKKAEKSKRAVLQKAHYFNFESDFLVRLKAKGGSHHARLAITIMSRDESLISSLKSHEPILRSHLIDIIAENDYRDLLTLKGKKMLRSKALAEVKRITKEQSGNDAIEAVLFTKYLVE